MQCRSLNNFLRDPATAECEFKLPEAIRLHVVERTKRHARYNVFVEIEEESGILSVQKGE